MYYPKVFYICCGWENVLWHAPTNFIMNSYKSIEKGKGLEWRVFFLHFQLWVTSKNLLSDWYKCVYLNSFSLSLALLCVLYFTITNYGFHGRKRVVVFNFVNSHIGWSFTRGISQILVTCQKGKLVKVETSLSWFWREPLVAECSGSFS